MPAHKKKDTTPQSNGTTSNGAPAHHQFLPENFHQYLRTEIRHATRMVMEEIMGEELSHFLGAKWGECSPLRKGYRNGFYTRNLMTTSGPIEDLNVPETVPDSFRPRSLSSTAAMSHR